MHNTRENTPDILGSIMSGILKKEESTTATVTLPPEELKEKATFNLPKQLLSELEDRYYELRKLCKSKQVSKTLIVEESLKLALEEFSLKKQNSALFHKILNAIKQ